MCGNFYNFLSLTKITSVEFLKNFEFWSSIISNLVLYMACCTVSVRVSLTCFCRQNACLQYLISCIYNKCMYIKQMFRVKRTNYSPMGPCHFWWSFKPHCWFHFPNCYQLCFDMKDR